jgi:diguanylate cyclase (GGDEF)-like protein/PAS domain S-box-containing protein
MTSFSFGRSHGEQEPVYRSAPGKSRLFLQYFLIGIIPSLVLLALLLLITYYALVPLVDRNFRRLKNETCRTIAEVFLSYLRSKNDEVLSREISLEDTKRVAMKRLPDLRFGPNGRDYIWIMSDEGRVLAHPFRTDIVGRAPGELPGVEGERLSALFRRMIGIALSRGGGFIDYEWTRVDKPSEKGKKTAYVARFEPWGWIIGTGIYIDDIETELALLKRNIVLIALLMVASAMIVSLAMSVTAARIRMRELAASKRMRESERHFRALFDSSPFGITLHRLRDGVLLNANRTFEQMARRDASVIIGRELARLALFDVAELERRVVVPIGRGESPDGILISFRPSPEEERILLLSAVAMETGTEPCILMMMTDITEQQKLLSTNQELEALIRSREDGLRALDEELHSRQTALEQTEKQLALIGTVFDHVGEAVFITDPDGAILSVNPAFTSILEYEKEEILGKNPRVFKSDRHPREFYEEMWNSLIQQHRWSGEVWNRRKSGEAFPGLVNITSLTDAGGHVINYIAVLRDMSALQETKDRLRHQVLHDALTSLPNRFLFIESLRGMCERAQASGLGVIVAMVGLDRFDAVNKTLGYVLGDRLLQEAARRMKAVFAEDGALARFGGDEFVVAYPFRESTMAALGRIERALEALRTPFFPDSHDIYMTASAGVSLFPQDGNSSEILFRKASLAMARAKKQKGNTYELFTDDMNELIHERIRMEGNLRRGIQRGEFLMYFQPKIVAGTQAIAGAEALMRWMTAEGTLVSPAHFIPLAEEIGEINRLGEFALLDSCKKATGFFAMGHPITVSVNVSSHQFSNPDFHFTVMNAIEKAGLDPNFLELEITESVVMNNLSGTVRTMELLRREGVRFSLDDFGTGYSSLSYIRHLPLSGIKVDKAFISDITGNTETQAIFRMLVSLTKELRLEITAEGVETIEQRDFIASLGSDILIQGYYYSRPLPPDDFAAFLGGAR